MGHVSLRGDRFFDSRQRGPVRQNFSLPLSFPLLRSSFFFSSFFARFLPPSLPFFSGSRLRAKFRPRANRTAALSRTSSRRSRRAELPILARCVPDLRDGTLPPFDGIVRSWLLRQIGRTASQESNASASKYDRGRRDRVPI